MARASPNDLVTRKGLQSVCQSQSPALDGPFSSGRAGSMQNCVASHPPTLLPCNEIPAYGPGRQNDAKQSGGLTCVALLPCDSPDSLQRVSDGFCHGGHP